MRRQIALAAALAATLAAAAACSSTPSSTTTDNALDGTGKTVKVWLMVDAESGWKEVVDKATERFKAATKADVKVEYQQWANRYTRLDTALAGTDAPDVVELGNTDMPKYVFNGAFAEIDKSRFENSGTWLTGLSDPCTLDGKVYCVPYYAGARVLIYRTDLLEKSGLKPPTTYAELLSAADKLKADNAADKNFAAFYMPGAYWYAAMSWVYGEGGSIAVKGSDGKWKGNLSDSKSVAGLQKWADLQKNYSKGDPTKDENDQDAIFAQGHAAFLYGNGWELGAGWISTSAMLARMNFASTLAGNQRFNLARDLQPYRQSPDSVLNYMLARVRTMGFTSTQTQAMLDYLRSTQWTGTDAQLQQRIPGLTRLIVGAGEYVFN